MTREHGLERITPRHSPELRCAYCHGPATGAEPCSECATLVHPDCMQQAGGCVTLGCRAARRPPPRAPIRRRRDLMGVVNRLLETNPGLMIANVIVWGTLALLTIILAVMLMLNAATQ